MSPTESRKFLDEALTMREFDHVHVLKLIGIVIDKEEFPLVVLPFMKHGDLLSYIRCADNVSLSVFVNVVSSVHLMNSLVPLLQCLIVQWRVNEVEIQ